MPIRVTINRRSDEADPKRVDLPARLPPATARPELPSGTVTFLLTEVARSVAQSEPVDPTFRSALAQHYELLRREFQRHGGVVVKETEASSVVAFTGASDALACAIAAQRAQAAHGWPEEVGCLRGRMALHTGDVELKSGKYGGLILSHAAEMLASAQGGQIVASEITVSLLRHTAPGILATGVQFTELGSYRLRTVTTPEQLFQVSYPGMAQQQFPPLNALLAHKGNLPLQFTRFFGRKEEIARLCELLLGGADGRETGTVRNERPRGDGEADTVQFAGEPAFDCAPSPRLVTLTGPGGSGKTRLALEVAERLRRTFHGALWFVALQDITDARLIPDKLLESLRLPRSPQAQPLEQAVSFLLDQPSLLLMDNFEHLVTEGSPLVQSLLEQVPDLICFVTSRQRLNLAAEQEFAVPPLPVPVDGPRSPVKARVKPDPSNPRDLAALTQCPSVQLFVDRAQAARPDFQVTRTNAEAVARLCARLEGLPLALVLAAARASVLSPQQMLVRLEHRFELLSSGPRGTGPPASEPAGRVGLELSTALLRAAALLCPALRLPGRLDAGGGRSGLRFPNPKSKFQNPKYSRLPGPTAGVLAG